MRRAKTTPSRCTGVLAAARTQGKRAQHGKPQSAVRDDQPDAREGEAGRSAGELPPSVHYLGIDVNESAIEAAQSVWGGDEILFKARDIREFDPVGDWDAIVFSEVLAYLTAHEAIAQVRRYAEALSPEGILAISMINDGKSRAIWRALRQEFRWIDGILWQQKEPWPSYRISVSRGHPGYLVGVLGLRH